MSKLTKPQKRVLRTMVQLKRCWISVYAGIQHTNRGRAEFVWFGFIRKQPRIRLGTVEVLERRGLVAERGWPFGAIAPDLGALFYWRGADLHGGSPGLLLP